MDTSLYIKVDFERGFDGMNKGPFLLEVERLARRSFGVHAEIFMDRKGDDSKLRVAMTKEERAKL